MVCRISSLVLHVSNSQLVTRLSSNCTAAIVMAVALALVISACGGGSSPITQPPPHVSTWTWVSGSNSLDQAGVYGTQGTASPSNMAGSRQFAASWKDSKGNFWLFGGNGFDSTGTQHDLNDLWKFDGKN